MKNNVYTHVTHTFSPIFGADSRLLILGTLPSVKSRENSFYYGHPQNRFWRVLSAVLDEKLPETPEEKTAMLLKHRIALWDVIAECDIIGSSDSSIKNAVPTDLGIILENSGVERIYANGGAAKRLYDKYQKEKYGKEIIPLPSTSPANAAWSLERLTETWKAEILRSFR